MAKTALMLGTCTFLAVFGFITAVKCLIDGNTGAALFHGLSSAALFGFIVGSGAYCLFEHIKLQAQATVVRDPVESEPEQPKHSS